MSGTDVGSMLQKNGWDLVRTKGSHAQYRKNGVLCTVPLHKELKKGTLQSIIKTVELSENQK